MPPVADATIATDDPSRSGGIGTSLTPAYHGSGGQIHWGRAFLVKFSLARLPPGATVDSTVLRLGAEHHTKAAAPPALLIKEPMPRKKSGVA
jgi:hypothetical protein